jgi:hypothetical protein
MNLVGHVAHKGEEEKYIQGFGGKPCRKETTGKSQVKMGE